MDMILDKFIYLKYFSLISVTYIVGTHWNGNSNVHLQHMSIQ